MNVPIRPIITEKSLVNAQKGWYTFATDRFARKEDIAKTVEKMFTVNVVSLRTVAMHGKTRRVGKAMRTVHKSDWKKTFVQLKEGQRIESFDVLPDQANQSVTK